MKTENLLIPEFQNAFSARSILYKTDLHKFFQTRSAESSEAAFRRFLYALEKDGYIQRIDAGVYTSGNAQTPIRIRNKFVPELSPEIISLGNAIKMAFPYTKYLIWETRILQEFMLHQPGQNQVILEVEKDAAESIFNFLNNRIGGKVFIKPDRLTFERYILPRAETTIVLSRITQPPQLTINGVPYPRLEKILVDVFADIELFYIFHGQELVHIFETAFERYLISEKALFRYAERRSVGQKIRAFIHKETQIQLLQERKEKQ